MGPAFSFFVFVFVTCEIPNTSRRSQKPHTNKLSLFLSEQPTQMTNSLFVVFFFHLAFLVFYLPSGLFLKSSCRSQGVCGGGVVGTNSFVFPCACFHTARHPAHLSISCASTQPNPPRRFSLSLSLYHLLQLIHYVRNFYYLLLCFSTIASPQPTRMSSPPASAATRRVPSPCWAHEETLALIEAYRDRWFALSRGNLRAPDWEAVAAALASSETNDGGSPKTSIQCRHKIEKLRKRYRAEKQRALSKPGRFFSSWDLFPVLDSMDIGVVGSVQNKHVDKAVKFGNIGSNRNPNVEIEREFMLLPGFMVKSNGVRRPHLAFDCNYGGGFTVKSRDDGLPPPSGSSYRSRAFPYFHDSDEDDDDDSMCGFPVKSLGDRSWMPLASRSVRYGKIDSDRNGKPSIHCDYDTKSDVDEGCGFGKITSGVWKSGPSELKSNSIYKKDGNTSSHLNYGRVWNANSYSTRSGFVKNSNGGVKRERGDAVSEVVSSIKRLGEVFVKMEKMKMETMREIEKMRMEIEMKRNQMILESPKLVVNAFAEAFMEKTEKKKVKTMSSNGDL